jgi:hypothetical protein
MVRWLLIEAVHHAVLQDPALRQDYQRLKFRRGHAIAKVAIARKLAVRMYWILRSGAAYPRLVRMQGQPGGHPDGREPIVTVIGRLVSLTRESEERIMVGNKVTE